MRPVNYISTTLFDSTLARFKVSVECRMTRLRQTDQTLEKLAYIDAKGNATIKPNIYLVFTYKGETFEDNKALYTSYPQLFKIRDAFETIKDWLIGSDAWNEENGVLEVNPEFKSAVTIAEIGKDKKWISLRLETITANENDSMPRKEKGVIVEISGQSRESSALSMDEFLTIYTIVKDLDLTSLQVQFGTMFLLGEESGMNYNNGYQNSYNNYQPQAPRNSYYQGQQRAPPYHTAPQAPRYNNQPAAPRAQRTTYSQSAPQAPQQTYQPYVQPAPRSQTSSLPPRQSSTPIVNLQAVEETPVDTVDWNNDQSIDSIFQE